MTSVVNRENTAEAAEAKTAKTAINPTGRFRGTKVPLPLASLAAIDSEFGELFELLFGGVFGAEFGPDQDLMDVELASSSESSGESNTTIISIPLVKILTFGNYR